MIKKTNRRKRSTFGTLERPLRCSAAEFLDTYYPRSTNFSVVDSSGELRVGGLSRRQALRQVAALPELLIKVTMNDTSDIITITKGKQNDGNSKK